MGSGVPEGTVLQVKYFEHDDAVSFTNSSGNSVDGPWGDAGPVADITMSNQSNKVMVFATASVSSGGTGNEYSLRLVRNINSGSYSAIGGNLDPTDNMIGTNVLISGISSNENGMTLSNNYLDAPNSTSILRYKLQLQVGESTGTIYLNRGHSSNNTRTWPNTGNTTIVLMEIQG